MLKDIPIFTGSIMDPRGAKVSGVDLTFVYNYPIFIDEQKLTTTG